MSPANDQSVSSALGRLGLTRVIGSSSIKVYSVKTPLELHDSWMSDDHHGQIHFFDWLCSATKDGQWYAPVVFHCCEKCDIGGAAIYVEMRGRVVCFCGNIDAVPLQLSGLPTEPPWWCAVCGKLTDSPMRLVREGWSNPFYLCGPFCADLFNQIVPDPIR